MTRPPSMAGAALSGWPSSSHTMFRRSGAAIWPPKRSLAATAPPTSAAALPPRPRVGGMAFSWMRWKCASDSPISSATNRAAR